MGFLKLWGKSIAYPYIYAGRTMRNSFGTMKEHASTVKTNLKRLRDEAAQVNAMSDDDGMRGKAAFKAKFAEAGWTNEALEKRRDSIVKSKWVCRFFCLLFFVLGISCFFVFPGFWGAIAGITLLLAMTLYVVRVFQACLYIAQIEERNLLTAKQFFSRADVFSRILFK